MKVDAIVLAGAPNSGKLNSVSSEEFEAMIPVNGKPMVNYVIETLQSSDRIENIVVVGPQKMLHRLPPGIQLVQSGETLTDNIFRGLEVLEQKNMVMLITSDIPFIHKEAIEDFLDRCAELESDIYYPIISREANEKEYPETVRTYVTLREGTFTGGNILLATPKALSQSKKIMEQVFLMRKKPWKLARLFGTMFVIKFFLRQLSLGELEKRASKILGFTGVAIISPYPEIGTDIDKPSDLELAERVMSVNGSKEAQNAARS